MKPFITYLYTMVVALVVAYLATSIVVGGMAVGMNYVELLWDHITSPYVILVDVTQFLPIKFLLGVVGIIVSCLFGIISFIIGIFPGAFVAILSVFVTPEGDITWLLDLTNQICFMELDLEDGMYTLKGVRAFQMVIMAFTLVFGTCFFVSDVLEEKREQAQSS